MKETECFPAGGGRTGDDLGQDNAVSGGTTDFPAIVHCDDSEENLLVSLELFEVQTELQLALWRQRLQVTAGVPPGAG